MKVWKTIWKKIFLDGCVISGTLIFILMTIGLFLRDLYDYLSRWVDGKYMGDFSPTATNRLFEQLGNVLPVFAFGGLSLGFMYAWQYYKDSFKNKVK